MRADRARVLVVRDPDAETEIETEGEVDVVVLDLGRSFDGPRNFARDLDEDEQREWIDSTLADVAELPEDSTIRARVVELVDELRSAEP